MDFRKKCITFAVMNSIKRWIVWLSRLHRCRGFGVQSPTDYSFVRYVVNEHWPYYAYSKMPKSDWLTNKLGRLYFRLANWRQPRYMLMDCYHDYWQAGCHSLHFVQQLQKVELARVDIDDIIDFEHLLAHCDADSVLVVENIFRNWSRWHSIQLNQQTGVTFDLYFCGIVFFDKQRYKQHYTINF